MNFWSKKNTYPDFWKTYLALFSKKDTNHSIQDARFVAFDTETTGFYYDKDRVLSIGAVAIKKGAIDVSDQLEIYLKQTVFKQETVQIHGIRKNSGFEKISEKKALELFIAYIGNSILIAHHAYFDQKMMNTALKRHGLGKLKNKILDTSFLFGKTKHQIYSRENPNHHYTLDELCNDLKISKSDRHTASGDAFITAIAFLKIVSKLKKTDDFELKDLFRMK